ncbi:hypothetical protein D8674_006155 [Pyrus ussuriensis x Pyrus communis]|uniref:Uncharacterized protein n=1 Tax=Pyrus ussuriensis x Pyrus communis TaxID=2448454 RepID=A0A5N5FTG7_9ROSA|nr:hypothetical protein D8674_006155 [Pyrus ussuriensis x Pyrus communis]
MDHDRIGTSCNIPQFFDGSNYVVWSEKFQIFLDAQDLIVVNHLTLRWKALSKLDEKIGYLKAHIEEQNEKVPPYDDKEEIDDVITALEAQVQKLLKSQENLMN